jgi:hypothetical protein
MKIKIMKSKNKIGIIFQVQMLVTEFCLYHINCHSKITGTGQSLPQTLLEDLDLETGMGYLRHGVSWVDSSLLHWEELL